MEIIGKFNATIRIEAKIFHDLPVYLNENEGTSLCGKDLIKILRIQLKSEFRCLKLKRRQIEVRTKLQTLLVHANQILKSKRNMFWKTQNMAETNLSQTIDNHQSLFIGVGKIKNYNAK